MLAPPNPRYATAMEILDAMTVFAVMARQDGWTVNMAIETGGPERINFAAERAVPPADEVAS